jgi:SAM-dependent methyltransferase
MFVEGAGYFTAWIDEHPVTEDMKRSIENMLGAERLRGAVLDLGCGPGRFLEFFASRAELVVGVDISRPFLDDALRRLRTKLGHGSAEIQDLNGTPPSNQGPSKLPHSVILKQGDMIEALSQDTAYYDVIFRAYTSLGYFSDRDEAVLLQLCRDRAQPDARLILDTFDGDFFASQPVLERLTHFGAYLLRERYTIDASQSKVNCVWSFSGANAPPLDIEFPLGVYDRSSVTALLEANGWKPLQFYRDYLGSMSSASAERLIVVARPCN